MGVISGDGQCNDDGPILCTEWSPLMVPKSWSSVMVPSHGAMQCHSAGVIQ